MLDGVPAPASTTSSCLPLAASFFTVSGVAATRVSPARVSRGMPMIMVSVPLAAGYSPCGSYLATTSGDRVGDRGSRLNSLRAAAQIRRARSISKHALDGAHDSCSSLRVTKMLEHHRARPDLPDGIGNAFTCDIRCGAMHGLEQRRVFAFGIDVRRWRDADRAAHGRAEIGQDVAEQVGAHHNIENLGPLHEMGAQDVDVILVGAYAGVACRHFSKAFVPVRHGDRDSIRLGRRCNVSSRPGRRELEGELQDSIDALAREYRFLEHDLALRALEHPAADRGVLAFRVFAHDDEIDVAGLAVRQGTRNAWHQPTRPQIHVLIEAATPLNQ